MSTAHVLGFGVVLAALVFFPGTDPGFERFHAPKLLVLLAVSAAAAWRERDRLSVSGWAVAGLAWLACSVAVSAVPLYALSSALCLVLVIALAALVPQLDEPQRDVLARWLIIAAGAVAVLVLAEAWAGFSGLSRTGRSPAATLGQRNLVAFLLVMALPPSLKQSADARGWLGALFFVAAALVLTRSRAGWLVGGLVVLASLATSSAAPGRRVAQAAFLVAGVSAAVSLPSSLAWRSSTPLRDTAMHLVDPSSASAHGRLVRWRSSLELIRARSPLGVGPGHWQFSYPAVSAPDDPTWDHQALSSLGRRLNGDLVALSVELGPGFVALGLLALGAALRDGWRARRLDSAQAMITTGALAALATVDVVFQVPLLAAFATMTLALTLAPQPPTPRRARALIVVLFASLGWSAFHAAGVFVRTRPAATIQSLALGAQLAPGDVEGHRALVEVLLLEARCDEARPLLTRLRRSFSGEPALRELSSGCQ